MVEDLIKHLHEQSQGRVKWFAMNKDESAYFIDFHTTWEAGEWMERQKKHSADWLEREGVHMVEKRIFTELEELAKQAADLIEQQAASIAELTTCKLCNSTGNSTPCAYPTEINRQQARRLTALESERDALLAAAGKEAVKGEPLAWLIDWPDEPDLGHYFGEEPNEFARSIPLYTAPTAALEKGGGRDAWISVDERLPEERQVVLVFRPDAHLLPACDPNIDCRCYFGNGVFNGIHPVTHWMPLPAPPAALYQKANDGLSLRAQHEDACIAANNNAQDAERYRWLRTLDSDFGNRNRMSEMARFYGETLDEAIDAALSQKAGEQQ